MPSPAPGGRRERRRVLQPSVSCQRPPRCQGQYYRPLDIGSIRSHCHRHNPALDEPVVEAGKLHISVLSAPSTSLTDLIPEILFGFACDGGRNGSVGEALDVFREQSWTSALSSIDRYRRDHQRHEQLAVSLAVGNPCDLPWASPTGEQAGLFARSLGPSPSSRIEPPAQEDPYLDNPYCESYYDPYDQPEDYNPAVVDAKPAPEISFEKYQELMKIYFTSSHFDPSPPAAENAGDPLEQGQPPPQPTRNNPPTSPLKEPTPQPPPNRTTTPKQPPPTTTYMSPPDLEPESDTHDAADNDESLRTFTEQAYKQLVSPIPSSVSPPIHPRSPDSLPSPERQEQEVTILSNYGCRIEESRGTRNRTMRRAYLRKRKREDDHPAARPNPAELWEDHRPNPVELWDD